MREQEKQEQKMAAEEIVVKNKLLIWLENFWYHYKWPTLVVTFFVIVGLVCFVQCSQREMADLTVAYAGGYTLEGEERQEIVGVLNSVAKGNAADGEESPSVTVSTFSIFTDDAMRVLCTDEDGNFSATSYQSMKKVSIDNLTNFSTYIMTGESAVWFVSEYVYTQKGLDAVSVPLTEIFGELPESAYNEYAIRLADTELYRYYDSLKILPKDTLILLPHSFVWGESADEETYAQFVQLFRAIVEFKAP